MRLYYCTFLVIGILLVGCKNDNSNQKAKPDTIPSQAQKETLQVDEEQLPSISQEFMTDLFMKCDFIDFVFYELPFSMSFDNLNTIQSTMSWISTSVPILTKNCKPIGRMVYQGKGEILVEAEMFISESDACGHIVWIIDGKPTYANRYNINGKNYMLGIINQGLKK